MGGPPMIDKALGGFSGIVTVVTLIFGQARSVFSVPVSLEIIFVDIKEGTIVAVETFWIWVEVMSRFPVNGQLAFPYRNKRTVVAVKVRHASLQLAMDVFPVDE